MERLPREQFLILRTLADEKATVAVAELAARLGIDQALVAAGAQILAERGWLAITETPLEELVLLEEGKRAAADGLPERRVLTALFRENRPLTMQELPALTGLSTKEVGSSLRHLTAKGWGVKQGPALALGPAAAQSRDVHGADEVLLAHLALRATGRAMREELVGEDLPVDEALRLLAGRRELLEVRAKRRRWAALTEAGRQLVRSGIEEAREVGQLTPDLLASGEWRTAKLKAYDVQLGVRPVHPGKPHPMQRVIGQTRRAFLEMGFEEVASPTVEAAFWNFDALFQPQDHPAREMQDTFYLENPARIDLPADHELVKRVAETHECGGQTGSVGWQIPWSRERAQAAVLRTHTTATTVRALAANPKPPRKVFSIGRVFRREAIDFKHLPVFHQVDGIIIDEAATFANLLGTLAAFYRKMGFEKFEFRPAFFPYTEPSVEVFIWVPEKKDWFEMGGAGIFRPEVTEPLGCRAPVLAWGLGLERLAMLRYDLLDMRALYLIDLEWLKEVPLCR